MPKTRKPKTKRNLERLADLIEAWHEWMVRNSGGFHPDIRELAGHLLVASTEDDEPTLEIYSPEMIDEWMEEFDAMRDDKEYRDEDDITLLNESRPHAPDGGVGAFAVRSL